MNPTYDVGSEIDFDRQQRLMMSLTTQLPFPLLTLKFVEDSAKIGRSQRSFITKVRGVTKMSGTPFVDDMQEMTTLEPTN
jgi:hypothetical protein